MQHFLYLVGWPKKLANLFLEQKKIWGIHSCIFKSVHRIGDAVVSFVLLTQISNIGFNRIYGLENHAFVHRFKRFGYVNCTENYCNCVIRFYL